MRRFSPDEIVVLNPVQTRYDLMSPRVFVPLYAAADDGLYTIKRGKFMAKYLPLAYPLYFLAALGLLVMFSGFIVTVMPYTSVTGLTSVDGLIGMAVGGLLVYLSWRALKRLERKVKENKDIEGELVVPWSQVRAITVANVRQVNVANGPSLVLNTLRPVYKEIGDWHVITWDGRDVVIPEVDDPYNKLNYVKVRFNLQF